MLSTQQLLLQNLPEQPNEEDELKQICTDGTGGFDQWEIQLALKYFFQSYKNVYIPSIEELSGAKDPFSLDSLIKKHYDHMIFSYAVNSEHQVGIMVKLNENQISIEVYDSYNNKHIDLESIKQLFDFKNISFTIETKKSYHYQKDDWSCGALVIANTWLSYHHEINLSKNKIDLKLLATQCYRAYKIQEEIEGNKSQEKEQQVLLKKLLLERIQYQKQLNIDLNLNPYENLALIPLADFLKKNITYLNQSFYELITEYNGYGTDRYGQILLNITYFYQLINTDSDRIKNQVDYFIQTISSNLQNKLPQEQKKIIDLLAVELEYKLDETENPSELLKKIANEITASIPANSKLGNILSHIDLDCDLYKGQIKDSYFFSKSIFLLEFANVIATKYLKHDSQLLYEKNRLAHEKLQRETELKKKREIVTQKLIAAGFILVEESLIEALVKNLSAYNFISKYCDNDFFQNLSEDERLAKIKEISQTYGMDIPTILKLCPPNNIDSVFSKISVTNFEEYYDFGEDLPKKYRFPFFKKYLNFVTTYKQVSSLLLSIDEQFGTALIECLPTLFSKRLHLFNVFSYLENKAFSSLYAKLPGPQNIAELIDDLKQINSSNQTFKYIKYLQYFNEVELFGIINNTANFEYVLYELREHKDLSKIFVAMAEIFITPTISLFDILHKFTPPLLAHLFSVKNLDPIAIKVTNINEFQQLIFLMSWQESRDLIKVIPKKNLINLFESYVDFKNLLSFLQFLVVGKVGVKFVANIISNADELLDFLPQVADADSFLKNIGLPRLRAYFHDEDKIKKLKSLIPDDLKILNKLQLFKITSLAATSSPCTPPDNSNSFDIHAYPSASITNSFHSYTKIDSQHCIAIHKQREVIVKFFIENNRLKMIDAFAPNMDKDQNEYIVNYQLLANHQILILIANAQDIHNIAWRLVLVNLNDCHVSETKFSAALNEHFSISKMTISPDHKILLGWNSNSDNNANKIFILDMETCDAQTICLPENKAIFERIENIQINNDGVIYLQCNIVNYTAKLERVVKPQLQSQIANHPSSLFGHQSTRAMTIEQFQDVSVDLSFRFN